MNKMLTVGTKFSGIGKIPILGGSRLNTLNSIIKAMFANNEQGFAYDPNDLTTLYQDAAGTIPVTAAGQPVGLVLDKSKGLGLERILTNSNDFTLSSDKWAKGNKVQFSLNPTSGAAQLTFIGNNLDSGNHFSYGGARSNFREMFEISFDAKRISGSDMVVGLGYGATEKISASENGGVTNRYSFKIFNNAGVLNRAIIFSGSSSEEAIWEVSNVSTARILGNHAYQTVSASRPILQQTHTLGNELITNGDFSDGTTGWSSGKSATLSTANGVLRVTNDPVTPEYGYAWTSFPTTVGKKYYVTARRIAGSANSVSNMHIGTSSVSTQIYNILGNADANKPWLFTATTATTYIGLNAQGNALSGWMEYDDISVKEVTGYRTDQNYLAFDGVDDFLQTNSIDFTATDKVSLFVGVRKLSDAARSMLVEFSPALATNYFRLEAPVAARIANYTFVSAGSSPSSAVYTNSIVAAPVSNVITVQGKIGDNLNTLRVDGSQKASATTSQGTGSYGNYPLYIGRRAGTSLPFTGHLYSLIGIGRLTSDSETKALEKAIAKNTGVTLNV